MDTQIDNPSPQLKFICDLLQITGDVERFATYNATFLVRHSVLEEAFIKLLLDLVHAKINFVLNLTLKHPETGEAVRIGNDDVAMEYYKTVVHKKCQIFEIVFGRKVTESEYDKLVETV